MGCDIHMVVEKFDYVDDSSRKAWQLINGHDGSYSNRNYDLFAVLADVRNAEKGDPDYIPPISKARGFPDDVTDAARAQLKESADHSFSHVTLEEVLAYGWDNPELQESGAVDALNALYVFNGRKPTNWCMAISGGSVRNIEPAEMKRLLAKSKLGLAQALVIHDQAREAGKDGFALQGAESQLLKERFPELANLYTSARWKLDLRERCKDFLDWIAMQDDVCRWNADHAPEQIRFVFGFDS